MNPEDNYPPEWHSEWLKQNAATSHPDFQIRRFESIIEASYSGAEIRRLMLISFQWRKVGL